jgi:DNA invertase Pin-like site-specific DNA recombinase
MFEDARRRRFDLVLFWSLDRFSREGVLATLGYLEQLTAAGVGWRSFTEQYLDSCGIFRDAVLAILAVVAKQERIRMRERINAGIAAAKRRGVRFGAKPIVVDAQKLVDLIAAGSTVPAAAKQMGISLSTAHRVRRAFAKRRQAGHLQDVAAEACAMAAVEETYVAAEACAMAAVEETYVTARQSAAGAWNTDDLERLMNGK